MVFSGVRVAPSLVFCVVLCRSLFVLLSFFIWPLCCLFCDIYVQILITPLVSSNSSYFYLEFKSSTLTSMVIYVKCKRYRYLFKCSLFPFTFLFSSTITGLCNVNTFPFCILKSLCINLFSCLFVFVVSMLNWKAVPEIP